MKRYPAIHSFFYRLGSRPVRLVLWLLFIISLSVMYRHTWRDGQLKHRISSDGLGYYSYLPALFIHHDMTFLFYRDIGKQIHGSDAIPFMTSSGDHVLNKYFGGEALLLLPFFLIAWLLTWLAGMPVDGYGPFFQAAVGVAATAYVISGLYALSCYLRRFLARSTTAIVIALLFLGTHLFFFTVFESSQSHAYSFALVCWYMLLARRSMETRSTSSYLALAAIIGLIVLTRPSNVLVLLALPWIASSWDMFRQWFVAFWSWKRWLPSLLIAAGIAGIQTYLYWIQEGVWWIDAYGEEGFDFAHPHIPQALFSFRAGLFIYAPLLLLGVAGLVVKSRGRHGGWYWFAVWFLINVYVISSWWVWHYEGTYGMRPLVDHLAFFALPMGILLEALHRRWRVLVLSGCVLLVGLQQFSSWQRFKLIIPWGGMDIHKYAFLFLNPEVHNAMLFTDAPWTPVPEGSEFLQTKMEGFEDFDCPHAWKGRGAFRISDRLSTEIMAFPVSAWSSVQPGDHLRFYLQSMVYLEKNTTHTRYIVALRSPQGEVVQRDLRVVHAGPSEHTWKMLQYSAVLGPVQSSADSVVVYVMNERRAAAWLDDLKVSLYRMGQP